MTVKNVIYRLISQFLYPLIFLIITICIIFLDIPKTVKIPVSDKIQVFDEDKDPVVITHITDLHISNFYEHSIPNFKASLNVISNYIKPTFNVITGDIADNLIKIGWPRKSGQVEEHFKLYNQFIKEAGVYDYTIEAIGNHDSWGISKITNESNVIKYFAHNNFTPSSFVEKNGIRIVTLNPYRAPTGVNPLINNPRLEKQYLAALEENLKYPTKSNDTLTIVITHYPSTTLSPQSKTPNTGLSYLELVSSCNVPVILNGHIHRAAVSISQNLDVVEITGAPSKMKSVFGILSIDNGQINYARINSTNPSYATISYPGSSLYTSSVISSYNGFVRLISFCSEAAHFSAELMQSGKDSKKCDLVKLRNISETATLYQCQFPSSEKYKGLYKLHVTGDLNFDDEIQFYVDQPFEIKQKRNTFYNVNGFLVGIGLGIVYHLLVFCGMFLPFSRKCFGEYSENILSCIFFGPFITGYRLKKLEIWAKLIYDVVIIWPTFCPNGFFYTGGERAIVLSWGFSAGGDFQWDNILILVLVFFLFFTAIGIQEFFLIAATPWEKSYIFDAIVGAILLLGSLFGWVVFSAELTNITPLIAVSFPFIFFPIITIIVVFIHEPLKQRRKRREAERERQLQLNDELLDVESRQHEGEAPKENP